MALRLRRGTDAERLLITPLQGELIYATDTKKLYVGDGATQGGVLVGPVDDTARDLVNDTTPQLGGDLDLNGNNITGTGSINIDGTITATGNINLGDAGTDEITVAGVINSNLRPAIDSTYDLGSQARRWQNIIATGLDVNGQATVDRLAIRGNIEGSDSTILYDADADSLTVSTIRAASIDGDLTGSVFSDDSGVVLVDSVAGEITGPVNNSLTNTNSLVIEGPLGGIDITTEGTIDDDYSLFVVKAFHNNSSPTGSLYLRGRGSTDNPTIIQAGDSIFQELYLGVTNDQPGLAATIEINADPDGTISDNIVPGNINLKTFNDSGNEVLGLGLNRDGEITVADNTLSAGVNPGDVDDSAVVSYLQITVGSTTYAMPLYAINPEP